ncbi:MAG: AMP-binding protein, partial [Deltaproteobacteria bacterium]|nr:AMP-binding protein [Deltaproteobacteria bacterium]
MSIGMEQYYTDKGDTWPKILKYNYEKYGDQRIAMRQKHYGIWQSFTWKDYYLHVKKLAIGLLSEGMESGEKVIIMGDNAPQYYYADLAVQANRGVSVCLYSELTPEEIKYAAENSEASFVIVDGQEQVDKFLLIKDDIHFLKRVIFWNYKGLAHYNDPILTGYEQILYGGEEYESSHPGIFEQNMENGKADDICAIVYTSGTTGDFPKGAIHTFKTMMAGSAYHLSLDPWKENDNVIPYVPPAWMTEQWFSVGCHLLSGCILNIAESTETQQRDMRETNPSIVIYDARLWESQAADVQARILGSDFIKRIAFHKLMPIGHRLADIKQRNQMPGISLKILYFFADILMFRHIRKRLGFSNARICYTSGTTLSPDAFRFFHALNLPLKSFYWSTEGGALSGAMNSDISFDTVGPVHEGAEVKITEDNELVYRQAGTFVGYQKDPERTSQVLKDGWFYSGDSAVIRDDKHIVFLDRMEDLITLSNGNKLASQLIESRLRISPHIRDAWVFGYPDRDFLIAVVVINYDNVSRWAGQNRVP